MFKTVIHAGLRTSEGFTSIIIRGMFSIDARAPTEDQSNIIIFFVLPFEIITKSLTKGFTDWF